MLRQLSIILFVFVGTSCGKSIPKLEDLDLKTWRDDKYACGGYRWKNIEAIKAQKEELLALKEKKVLALLGRPDRNELYKRNQKFFYYYLQPGPACANTDGDALQLVIRFNAMGLAKEVAIE
jgi:hypothetical protein